MTNYLPRIAVGGLIAVALGGLTACAAPAGTPSTSAASHTPAVKPVKDTGGVNWRAPATLALWTDLAGYSNRIADDATALDAAAMTAECTGALTVIDPLEVAVADGPLSVRVHQQAALRDYRIAMLDCVAGDYDKSATELEASTGEVNQATAAIVGLSK